MTPKEVKILDKEIQYLCEQQDRVKAIREYTGINPGYTFLREVETIETVSYTHLTLPTILRV